VRAIERKTDEYDKTDSLILYRRNREIRGPRAFTGSTRTRVGLGGSWRGRHRGEKNPASSGMAKRTRRGRWRISRGQGKYNTGLTESPLSFREGRKELNGIYRPVNQGMVSSLTKRGANQGDGKTNSRKRKRI